MAADGRQVSWAWRWPHLLVWFPMASTESLRSCASLTAWYNENAGGRVIDDHPDPVDLLSRPILLWADYHDWAVRLFSDFGCRRT